MASISCKSPKAAASNEVFPRPALEEFKDCVGLIDPSGLLFVNAKIEMGSIERPPYGSIDFKFNKYQFATYIEETEKKPVLRLRSRSPFTGK